MRTLSSMPAEKKKRIAQVCGTCTHIDVGTFFLKRGLQETLDIFAPLAHRLGVWSIKEELEDRAFAVLEPAGYAAVK